MSLDFWLLYSLTVFVASIVPGPSMLLALTHGMKYGCRRTVATAMGNVTASVIQAGVSMAGLGAVLMASGTVFVLIKWCGAAYLIYTGITILRAPALNLEARSPIGAGEVNSAWHKRFMQAFWVAAGNPKAIVFFTALFPQFINTRGAHFEQLAVMVVTLAGIAFACFMIYAAGGDRITLFLHRTCIAKWIQRLIGGTFIGIGVGIASSRQG